MIVELINRNQTGVGVLVSGFCRNRSKSRSWSRCFFVKSRINAEVSKKQTPNTSYTLLRNTASIMKIFFIQGATNLAKLDLSGNHLQFLPEGVFDFLNLDGLEINLYKNWFECNCRMAWFKKWMDDVRFRKVEVY